MARAVRGVDVIVHCATTLRRRDVAVARRLLDAAAAAGTPQLIFPSIVGGDRIRLGYYRTKFECERLIESSGLSWTVLRATQFHSLFTRIADALRWLPVLPVPIAGRASRAYRTGHNLLAPGGDVRGRTFAVYLAGE